MWEETCVYIYSAYGRAALLDQSRTKGSKNSGPAFEYGIRR